MKKIVILSLISLLIPIVCFSQNTYNYPKILNDSLVVITHSQLKEANLIFLDHSNLKILNNIQKQKINIYKRLELEYKLNDSIKTKQICVLQNTINDNNKIIDSLNSTINKKQKKLKRVRNWAIGGTIINIGFLIFCIL